MVPRVLLLAEVCLEVHPSSFNMGETVRWPAHDQRMEGLNVLEDDLVRWIHVFVLLLVIDHVSDASGVLSMVSGKGLAECLGVSRG